jgi:Uma2 family endonuclease
MPKEKRTSKNYKDLTLEELLQLPPEEMMAALKEQALNSELIVLPPKDHPIFQGFLKGG